MSVNVVQEKVCPEANPATLDLAQFTPNTVEEEENTVKFGPTSTEGSVFLYSNMDQLDIFFLQTCNDQIESQIQQFWDYTDGYAMRLKYSFDRSLTNGMYGACVAAPTEQHLSCWAFTQATNEATNLSSYYFTSTNVNSATLDLSSQTALTVTSAWNVGFNKLWSCDTVVTDSTQNHITCNRFLPNLVNNASPADDFRFAPLGSKNPSQATSTQAWIYGGTTGTGATWATYTMTLQGALGTLGTIGALAVTMLAY